MLICGNIQYVVAQMTKWFLFEKFEKNVNAFICLDNTIGNVKAHFSQIDDSWMVQTEKIDVKIKVHEPTVKLYDLTKGRRISGTCSSTHIFNGH